MDHALNDPGWCTVAQLNAGMVQCKRRPTKGGYWHIPAFMCTLKATDSKFRLLSRRKAPYMYLRIANLQAATGGFYILVGRDRRNQESHAVAVDTYRQPAVFLSGLSATPQILTQDNLRNLKYPLHNLVDIAQIMVRA
jgi:hypothetical protein